ncbi:hypothetical protein ACHAPJ_006620 [Fusarium lateritium]
MRDDSDETAAGRDNEPAMGKPNKRLSRVSQACEPCRVRKSKCDGRQPVCTVCKRQRVECSYDPKPRKRGLRPGQYSSLERRALLAEMIAAFLLSKTPDSADSVRAFFSFEDPDLPFLSPGEKQAELDVLLDNWKKGPMSQWLCETAARTDPTLDQMSRLRANQASGTGAGNSITVGGDDHSSSSRVGDQSSLAARSPQLVNPDVDMDMDLQSQNQTQANNRLQALPNDLESHFEKYFAYTHTWLPFVDKFKLTASARSSSRLPQYASELTSSQSANLSLIWAIVAYASLRSTRPGSRISSAEAAKHSLALIPAFDPDMAHEHIQALVILSLYFFESGGHRTSWLLIGLAGRVVVDLSSVTLGQHLSSISRRTSLACFVAEGVIAAGSGRKSQLPTLHAQDKGWTKALSAEKVYELEAEGWEEWSTWDMPGCNPSVVDSLTQSNQEPFRVLSTFNQTVALVEILNTMPYSPNSSKRVESPSIQVDTPVDGPPELSTWAYRVAESHPPLAPMNGEGALLPQTINLHAVYLLIRSMFHSENHVMKQDEKRYQEISHSLASAINTLAVKFQTAYPLSSLPLGLSASMTTAMRLLSVDSPLRHSLSKMLSTVRHNGEVGMDLSEVRPFSWRAQGAPSSSLNVGSLFAGQGQGLFKVPNKMIYVILNELER